MNHSPYNVALGSVYPIVQARRLFRLDTVSDGSLPSQRAHRHVLDDGPPARGHAVVAGEEETVPLNKSGRWQTTEFVVSGKDLRKPSNEADLTISSNQPLTLHMVEILKATQ